MSTWWQMFSFVLLCPTRWLQFNSRTVRTHFSSIMTLNNWKMIAETRSYIFRWRSRFRRRCVCLSSPLNSLLLKRRRKSWSVNFITQTIGKNIEMSQSEWDAIFLYFDKEPGFIITIIPRARMGSESIAHEAEGRMGYWLIRHANMTGAFRL